MVGLRRRDQLRVDVDANHGMTTGRQLSADPARPATGVKNSLTRCHDRVQQTGLPCEIDPVSGHLSEPVDVPPRVFGALVGEPARWNAHESNLDGRAPPGRCVHGREY